MADPTTDDQTDPSDPGWRILAFPALGRRSSEGDWRVELEGVIYQSREIGLRKRMLLRVLRRVMKVDPAEFDPQLFRSRVEAFVGTTDKGWQPLVSLADGSALRTRRTRSNGRFSGVFRLPASAGAERAGISANGTVPAASRFEVRVTGDAQGAVGSAPIFLVPDRGVSVVSDIDDTIKHTDVRQRREMLLNTFARPFAPVDGMARAYRRLAEQQVFFHYVSSSPWQLFTPLDALLREAEFPAGTIHLRNYRLRDHMLRRVFLLHRRGKGGVIRHLLESFPRRRFLLVGDSGERDPKIYCKLALKHPRQIAAILIRVLDEEHRRRLAERWHRSPVLASRLMTFADADEFLERSAPFLASGAATV